MYHKKHDKRSKESSLMIYQSLIELIRQKDYSKITVKDIVDHANIGRSTFYRNYEKIDDVLLKKSDEEFSKCVSYLLAVIDTRNSNSGPRLLSDFIRIFFSFWYDNSEILEILQEVQKFDMIETSLLHIIQQVLEYSTTQGIQISHPEYFIAVRVGIIKSVLFQWIKDDKNIPPKELSELIVRQLLLENRNLLTSFQRTFI